MLAPTRVRADAGGTVGVVVGFGIVSIVTGAVGVVSGISLADSLARQKRPSDGMLLLGPICGTVNMVAGGLLVGLSAPDGEVGWKGGVALGTAYLAVGALDLGLAIWAGTLPERGGRSVHVLPALLPTPGGNIAPGLALDIAGF